MRRFRTVKDALPLIGIALSTLVLVALILFDRDIREVGPQLQTMALWCLPAALGCMVVMWLCEAGIIAIGCIELPGDVTFLRALRISLIGQYYSALTPFSSGGQPMQVAYMKRWSVPAGSSTTVFLLKFVYWQVVMTGVATVGMVRCMDMLRDKPGLLTAVSFGIFVNALAALAGILPMLRVPSARLRMALAQLAVRLRITNSEQKAVAYIDNWVDDFALARGELLRRPWRQVALFFLTVGQLFALLSVTYVLYRGFGLHDSAPANVLYIQCMLMVAVAFVPLPGAAGASEGVFYMLYTALFPRGMIIPAMILWRLITYYLHLAVGTLVLLADQWAARNQKTIIR